MNLSSGVALFVRPINAMCWTVHASGLDSQAGKSRANGRVSRWKRIDGRGFPLDASHLDTILLDRD